MAMGAPQGVMSTDPLQLLAMTDKVWIYPQAEIPPENLDDEISPQLIIKQKVEMMEMLTGFETANKYQLKNMYGQVLLVFLGFKAQS